MPPGAGGRLKRSVDTEYDAVESLSTLSDAGGKPAKPAAHLFKKTKEHDAIPANDHQFGAGRSSNDGRADF